MVADIPITSSPGIQSDNLPVQIDPKCLASLGDDLRLKGAVTVKGRSNVHRSHRCLDPLFALPSLPVRLLALPICDSNSPPKPLQGTPSARESARLPSPTAYRHS